MVKYNLHFDVWDILGEIPEQTIEICERMRWKANCSSDKYCINVELPKEDEKMFTWIFHEYYEKVSWTVEIEMEK